MFSTIDSSRNIILLSIEVTKYSNFRNSVLLQYRKNLFGAPFQVWHRSLAVTSFSPDFSYFKSEGPSKDAEKSVVSQLQSTI